MSHFANQKRNSFAKLALFFGFGDSCPAPAPTPNPPIAPRTFPADAAVGLGIVAAMSTADTDLARPEPIAAAAKAEKRRFPPVDEMEQCESYTCVISYLGGNPVRKRVYYGDGDDGIVGELWGDKIVFFEEPPPAELVEPPFQVAEFLRCCFRCKKELDGLDIYVYRGDKAFCSMECRSQQMVLHELSKKLKNRAKGKHEGSMSPSPAPLVSAAEVIMA